MECREYIEQHLPALKQSVARQIPDLQVVKVVKRNRFPLVKAQYGKHRAGTGG